MKLATGIRKNATILVFFSVTLMVLASPGAGLAVETQSPPSQAPRAAQDIEPNDDYANATMLQSGDVVNGSLLVTPPSDVVDVFKISVPLDHVLKFMLYMVDYDINDPGRINFGFFRSDSSTNRTEYSDSFFLQPGQNVTVRVYANRSLNAPYPVTSDPGRYRLTVVVEPIQEVSYQGGKVSGYLHYRDGPDSHAYKMNPAPIDEAQYTASLKCPITGNFDLTVRNWQNPLPTFDGDLNSSTSDYTKTAIQASFIGIRGQYYIFIYCSDGFGAYELSLVPLLER